MRHAFTLLALVTAALSATTGGAVVVPGGGSKTGDCMSVFDAPGANFPPAPKAAKHIDCTDGDPSCDADGLANAKCSFPVQLCMNSTQVVGCTPNRVDSLTIAHALDNGDKHFDTDFQALQARVDQIVPTSTSDRCTLSSTITVPLKPTHNGLFKKNIKKVSLLAAGFTTIGRPDKDVMKFTCRAANGGVYGPRDLYSGTFDRIAQQVFAPSCALSGCHDSNTNEHDLTLYPNVAYSQTVGVVPVTPAAALDGLFRIDPAGDPLNSLLYRKVTGNLPAGYGAQMPFLRPAIAANLQEIIRLWIIGDGVTPAPQTGWVAGTDQ